MCALDVNQYMPSNVRISSSKWKWKCEKSKEIFGYKFRVDDF